MRMDLKIVSLCVIGLFSLTKSQAIYTVVGDDFYLECSQSSYVDWYHGDAKLEENDRIIMNANATNGVVASSLIVRGLNSSDEGIYQCRARDSATVYHEFDVKAVEIEGNQVALHNSSISIDLQCLVKTDIKFEPIQWERSGEEISNTSSTSRYTILNLTVDDANQTTLRINKPEEMDIGPYTCIVELVDSNDTLRQEASIAMKPQVEPILPLKIKVEDETAKIECKVKGYPTPSMKWYRTLEQDGASETEIEYDERVSTESSEAGVPDAILVVKNLKIKEDRGFYKCVATNYLGESEKSAHLKVKDKNAAVWPFLGICAEVITLCCIIFIFENRRNRKMEEEEEVDAVKQNLVNGNGADEEKLELRQRANGDKSS